MKKLKTVSASLLLTASLLLSGCTSVQANDLTEGIVKGQAEERAADSAFINANMDFSLKLFKNVQGKKSGENVLVSPLSVTAALAMTANGADGETLAEMEKLLGGDIPLEQLNSYLYSYLQSMTSGEGYKLHIANSVWFRNDPRLTVEKDFLQKTVDYYDAEVYREAFDDKTLGKINGWVKANTDSMIPKIIEKIEDDSVMYLINALAFDSEWEEKYEKDQIGDGTFTDQKGNVQNVEMMNSHEFLYLEDDSAIGFLKDYKGGKYSFGALLPNECISLEKYIEGLTSESLLKTVSEPQHCSVITKIPKFSFEFGLSLNDALKEMGMPSAFGENADLSKIGKSSDGNLYIGNVLHKTFIEVDEKGTKAGAATVVDIKNESAAVIEDPKTVILDRPFVFMIIDNETRLPIFLGAVESIE
ncbi:MAG: serine protease inhibitor [Ruminococcaceae bacterium]|nr:serine protease inhibitor [Oscillospiraceae bacterium]